MSTKRKAAPAIYSRVEPMYGDAQDDYDSDGDDHSATRKGQSKPGETVVTKRTLQNRKAQREFRKRREARVRDLEERCRRFDQMGLEANVELQRVARNLKEENEALRGFVIRIGYGNMMPTILEGVGNSNASTENSFQPSFAGDFGGSGGAEGGKGNDEGNGNGYSQPSPSEQHNPLRSNDSQIRSKMISSAPDQNSFNNAKDWIDQSDYSNNQTRKNTFKEEKVSASPSSEGSSSSSQTAPLLSLNLYPPGAHQSKFGDQQRQPEFTTTNNDDSRLRGMLPASISPNSAMNNLLNQMNGQMNGANTTNGSGMVGSAMLGGYAQNSPRSLHSSHHNYGPYPVPQRIQQNDALLNPNPIPFAFNLSNEPPQPNSSWWEQMGGARFAPGQETGELDEKAQAVATAQSNNGGAQSPFDLSAFLQGGITPGGGFSMSNFGSGSQDDIEKEKSSASGSGQQNDTDHMRTFIRLLERKVAEREAQTVATLGFQPPSQDPAQRRRMEISNNKRPTFTSVSSLTPTGVYSRLAEHPAFLSTDARELEELVDALGSGAARSPSRDNQSNDDKRSLQRDGQNSSSPINLHQPSNSHNTRSPSSSSGNSSNNIHGQRDDNSCSRNSSNSSVEIDERAIDRLLGLLDQKRIFRGMDERGDHEQRLSMAMT